MTPPLDLEALAELVGTARHEFFSEFGDSASSLILDAYFYKDMVTPVLEDGTFSGLTVTFHDSTDRPVLLAATYDPLNDCENCRGL